MGDESATDAARPKWLNDIGLGTIAVFTLDDGERVTADILRFDEESDELVVDVVGSNRRHTTSARRGRVIPVSRVVSAEPRSRVEQPWPYCDPCRGGHFSRARTALMVTLFLCATVGGVRLFLVWVDRPYGVQVASVFIYTFAVVFYSFAAVGSRYPWGKELPPFMFTCPAVQPQLFRLLWRHLGFLVVLVALQTGALAVRPDLPAWWNTDSGGHHGGPPSELALLFLCCGLGWIQVYTNRRLLDRAHREFAP